MITAIPPSATKAVACKFRPLQRHRFAKSATRVLEYWNDAIALFHGPPEIAPLPFGRDPKPRSKAKKEFVA